LASPFTFSKYLQAKEELWKLKYFTMQKYYLKKQLVWPVPLAQVLARPQLIFPSKTWIFGIYLNFQLQKSLKKSISPTF
jgi:hypothetical protein